MRIKELIQAGKRIRVIGFDDAPFGRSAGAPVKLLGVVTNRTRFEGMLTASALRDGTDAGAAIIQALSGSKFLPQVAAVLTDGIAFGGFNVVDIRELSAAVDRPVIAVMRRRPNLEKFHQAMERLDEIELRRQRVANAGSIHQIGGFTFQSVGVEPEDAAALLAHVTDNGRVPEALRLAHLIGAALVTGESSNRA